MKSKKLKTAVALSAIMVVIAVFAVAAYLSMVGSALVPSLGEVKKQYSKSDAVLYDRHGVVIQEMRVDFGGRKLDWTPLNDISPALLNAVIASEDKRYYSHKGVDWIALGSTLVDAVSSHEARGASTITMQLASMLDKSLKPEGTKRSIRQKWRQVKAALTIERMWGKDDILEAYLNLVTFRGELQGISASSRGLFGKEPGGLNIPESLILASLIRAPNAQPGVVTKRASNLAAASGYGNASAGIEALAMDTLSRPYILKPKVELAPQVAARLLSIGKRQATCTLDGTLQKAVSEMLSYCIISLAGKNVQDGAVLVADNMTGEVLAYVANTGRNASARYVDGVQAPRQAGSTLKPFLYGLAFEKRLLTPASLVDDSPIDVPTLRGIYSPEDYDKEFRGIVSVRVALASSLNVPAVRTLNITGVDDFARRLGEVGFTGLQDGDYYGLSLALGTAEVSLWELTNAYRTLANGGLWSALKLSSDEKTITRRVYSPESAFIISDILSDREARSTTFGLENPLSTGFWSAVKTGTSKDMKDNWCIGYSAKYTVGVWVGNFSGEPMWNVSGTTGAAPIWLEVMNLLHKNEQSKSKQMPGNLVVKVVDFLDSGYKKKEWFIKGTETELVKLESRKPSVRIIYPSDDSIIAIDPDIPLDNQKVFFESTPEDARLHWVLNGNEVGAANSLCVWTPVKGHYKLEIVDGSKKVLAKSEFSVR